MPHRDAFRTLVAPAIVFFLQAQLAVAQLVPTPTRTDKPNIAADLVAPAMTTPQCQAARNRADALLAEVGSSVPAAIRTSVEQSAARPGAGGSTAKAFGDAAAAYLLTGNTSAAAWAGLKAAVTEWNGETVTNAGVYLFHLGKNQDALQFLTCAYGSGYRSPYLLEALAIVHHASGTTAEARRFINEAAQADPDDVMIETEASFINTGGPPPSRPPQRDPDGLDEGLRELEQHAQRALAVIKAHTDEIQRSVPAANARGYQQISVDYITKVVEIAREQARSARSAVPPVRETMISSTLAAFVASYSSITDQVLSYPDTTNLNGSPLLFWSDVLRLDSAVLSREQESSAVQYNFDDPALAQPALNEFRRSKDAGDREYTDRLRACTAGNDYGESCRIRETARWCGVWKELYQKWENASRQRHNAAARGFDRIATREMIKAENEYLQTHDYAVRQVQKMKFPSARATGGYSIQEVTLSGINSNLKSLYDKQLSSSPDTRTGVVTYLRDRARWFVAERESTDKMLASEADDIKRTCEPALRALLELLAQEEWQAYLDHLRDRLTWNVQPQTESSFPCEGEIGPLTIEADLNKPGEGKFDLKWKGKSFRGGGSVTVGGGGVTGAGGGIGFKTTSGVTLNATGSNSGPGFGGSAGYGPFQGKAKVSLTSKVSPWNGQEYLGIKIKGSAGLGLSTRRVGVKCYPSSGSVTIYPRAFYEDAVKYLSTPSSRPASRTR